MPRGGHNRVPDEVKRARGTFRADRATRDTPRVTVVPVPAPPDDLPDDARRIWLELKQEVDGLGVYSASDLGAFRRLFQITVYAERLDRDPEAPAKDVISMSKEVRAWRAVFGLHPQARSTVRQLPDADGKVAGDALDEWFPN
jgi:hypothetical protein